MATGATHLGPGAESALGPTEVAALERVLHIALTLRGLALTVFGAVLPSVMMSFHLNNAQASALPLVSGLGATTAALSVGPLADRWGPRRAMLMTAWALLLAALSLTLAPAWIFFILGALLVNWGAGGMATVTSVLLTMIYRRRSGSAFNRSFLFVGVGSLISPLIASATLAATGSWRWVFAILTVAFTALFITVMRAPYPSPEPRRPRERARGGRPWWRQRTLALCALALVCYVGAEVAMTTWAARFLAAEREASIVLSASVVSIFWAGIILGRYGFSRVLRPGNEKRLIGGAGTVAALAVVGFTQVPGHVVAIAMLVIAGGAFGGMWPTIMSYAAARAEGSTGTASGLLIALGFLGAVTVPALIGVLSTWTGLSLALSLDAIFIALSALLFALA
ncbi:MAG TPA: MFS transporter [Caldilineae bacterium]|nr:MFS transporter [Caldilineae bacterium]